MGRWISCCRSVFCSDVHQILVLCRSIPVASGWCQTSSPKKILGGIQVLPIRRLPIPFSDWMIFVPFVVTNLEDHGDFHRLQRLFTSRCFRMWKSHGMKIFQWLRSSSHGSHGSSRGVSHLHGRGRSECFRGQRCGEVLFQPAGIEPFPGDLGWFQLEIWSYEKWKRDWSLLASFGISKQRWARFFCAEVTGWRAVILHLKLPQIRTAYCSLQY